MLTLQAVGLNNTLQKGEIMRFKESIRELFASLPLFHKEKTKALETRTLQNIELLLDESSLKCEKRKRRFPNFRGFSLEKVFFAVVKFLWRIEHRASPVEAGIVAVPTLAVNVFITVMSIGVGESVKNVTVFSILAAATAIGVIISGFCEERLTEEESRIGAQTTKGVFLFLSYGLSVVALILAGVLMPTWHFTGLILKGMGGLWLGRALLRLRKDWKEAKEKEQEETQLLSEEEAHAHITVRIKAIIDEQRQEVLAADSEFSVHLASREQTLDKARRILQYWEKRKKFHPDKTYVERRVEKAHEAVRLITEDIAAFQIDKQAMLAGLRELDGQFSEAQTEITDHVYDRELDDLFDQAQGFRAESEMLVFRRVSLILGKVDTVRLAVERVRRYAIPALSGSSGIVLGEIEAHGEKIGNAEIRNDETVDQLERVVG